MRNSVGTYSKYCEERIRNHDSMIGYMGMITDYLLFEKNGDFHLKLMITIWDYDKYTTEVKYLNYITTWGKDQFFKFCMNFCLLRENEEGEFECQLDSLLGDYCVVNYYEKDSDDYADDKLNEVIPVIDFFGIYNDGDIIDMWEDVNFEDTFKDVETVGTYDEEFYLSDYISNVKEHYRKHLNMVMEKGYRIGYIYNKYGCYIKTPENPKFTADIFLNTPKYYNHNLYELVTENSVEIDYAEKEPPLRKDLNCKNDSSNDYPIEDLLDFEMDIDLEI